MDLVPGAFIMFLVKIVPPRPVFLEMIRWTHTQLYRPRSTHFSGYDACDHCRSNLRTFSDTKIKLRWTSYIHQRALYVFALFGIAVAPFFEEIIFRGFLVQSVIRYGWNAIGLPRNAFPVRGVAFTTARGVTGRNFF
jgi:hypothetical protein